MNPLKWICDPLHEKNIRPRAVSSFRCVTRNPPATSLLQSPMSTNCRRCWAGKSSRVPASTSSSIEKEQMMFTYTSCCSSPTDSYSSWVHCFPLRSYITSAAATDTFYMNSFAPKEHGIPQTSGLAKSTSPSINYSTLHLENFFSPRTVLRT